MSSTDDDVARKAARAEGLVRQHASAQRRYVAAMKQLPLLAQVIPAAVPATVPAASATKGRVNVVMFSSLTPEDVEAAQEYRVARSAISAAQRQVARAELVVPATPSITDLRPIVTPTAGCSRLIYKLAHASASLMHCLFATHGFGAAGTGSSSFGGDGSTVPTSGSNWHAMWVSTFLKSYAFQALSPGQVVNQFPRTYEVTRKDALARNIMRMQQVHGERHFAFIPATYVLPSDAAAFNAACAADPSTPWIVKPAASSQGRGIYITTCPKGYTPSANPATDTPHSCRAGAAAGQGGGGDGMPAFPGARPLSGSGAGGSSRPTVSPLAMAAAAQAAAAARASKEDPRASGSLDFGELLSSARAANSEFKVSSRGMAGPDLLLANAHNGHARKTHMPDVVQGGGPDGFKGGVEDNCIVSRYVDAPACVDGFKFDLRVYAVVTNFHPLKVYIHKEGLARFATEKYSRDLTQLGNKFIHLTNYSLNKNSEHYQAVAGAEGAGHKWTLSALLARLAQDGMDVDAIWSRVEELIVKTILSIEGSVTAAVDMFVPCPATNCYQLFGFDVMLDEALFPWLIEVNFSPSLAADSPLDLRVKSQLLADTLNLVGVPSSSAATPLAAMSTPPADGGCAAAAGMIPGAPKSPRMGPKSRSGGKAALQVKQPGARSALSAYGRAPSGGRQRGTRGPQNKQSSLVARLLPPSAKRDAMARSSSTRHARSPENTPKDPSHSPLAATRTNSDGSPSPSRWAQDAFHSARSSDDQGVAQDEGLTLAGALNPRAEHGATPPAAAEGAGSSIELQPHEEEDSTSDSTAPQGSLSKALHVHWLRAFFREQLPWLVTNATLAWAMHGCNVWAAVKQVHPNALTSFLAAHGDTLPAAVRSALPVGAAMVKPLWEPLDSSAQALLQRTQEMSARRAEMKLATLGGEGGEGGSQGVHSSLLSIAAAGQEHPATQLLRDLEHAPHHVFGQALAAGNYSAVQLLLQRHSLASEPHLLPERVTRGLVRDVTDAHWRMIAWLDSENTRRGGFTRVFPTDKVNGITYRQFFEEARPANALFGAYLMRVAEFERVLRQIVAAASRPGTPDVAPVSLDAEEGGGESGVAPPPAKWVAGVPPSQIRAAAKGAQAAVDSRRAVDSGAGGGEGGVHTPGGSPSRSVVVIGGTAGKTPVAVGGDAWADALSAMGDASLEDVERRTRIQADYKWRRAQRARNKRELPAPASEGGAGDSAAAGPSAGPEAARAVCATVRAALPPAAASSSAAADSASGMFRGYASATGVPVLAYASCVLHAWGRKTAQSENFNRSNRRYYLGV